MQPTKYESVRVRFEHSSHHRVLWKYFEPCVNAVSFTKMMMHGVYDIPVYLTREHPERGIVGYISGWDFESKKKFIQFSPKPGEAYDEFVDMTRRWGRRVYVSPDFIRRNEKITGLRGFYVSVEYLTDRTLQLVKESWGGD